MILYPVCYVEPSILGTLDFIGFSDGLEDQELYVFSPSVLPKIQGMFLRPFFSCFQRKLLEVRESNFWKSQKRTSGLIGRKGVSRIDALSEHESIPKMTFFRQSCGLTVY